MRALLKLYLWTVLIGCYISYNSETADTAIIGQISSWLSAVDEYIKSTNQDY